MKLGTVFLVYLICSVYVQKGILKYNKAWRCETAERLTSIRVMSLKSSNERLHNEGDKLRLLLNVLGGGVLSFNLSRAV